MHELKNVVRGVANSVAPHLRALGGMETQPVASFRLKRVPLPLFVQCSHVSTLGNGTRNDCYAGSSPSQHMSAKALVLQAFHLGESREVTREQNAKKSVLSHLVSFATNGELELEFRGKLIIGTRRGACIWEGLIIGCIFLVNR